MTDTNNKSNVLEACLAKSQNIASLVKYADDSVVSKTLLNKPVGTITLFAFDKGQGLSEHQAPFDAVVQVIDGVGRVTIDGTDHDIATGEIIIMPANIPHSVSADQKFKMQLTMIRQ
jgi:quercetin dioxygenase-like cupin family protein